MRAFDITEAQKLGTEFCTRCYGLKCEILSFNDLNTRFKSEVCNRPIKYKVFNLDGSEQKILYCDLNGRCNSNKYILVDCTHDLMIKN